MNESIKAYANTLYEASLMESGLTLAAARKKASEDMAERGIGNNVSGMEIQNLIRLLAEHVERCATARLNSFKQAHAEAPHTPSPQDLTYILHEWQAVYDLQVKNCGALMMRKFSSPTLTGVPRDMESMIRTESAHGYDRVLREWKVWKARTELRPVAAKNEERERRRDSLTNACDRSEFDHDLSTLLAKAGESAPLGIVFMDIDKFKAINDGGEGSHERGDRALQAFAGALFRACECKGAVYRFGGDEFCVLLGNHSTDESMAVAERIRREVSAIRTEEIQGGLSTSIGVACFPESTEDGANLVHLADVAMYASKNGGGNKVSKYVPA